MCLFVSRIFANVSITVKKILTPVGCQTSKIVFFPSLYSGTVLWIHVSTYICISSTCIHMCGTEKIMCVKLQFYLRMCLLLCKWFDRSQAGSILGPEAHSFSCHLNLFLPMSLDDTADICLAACCTSIFHCPIDLWGFVRSFLLSFPSLSLVSPRGHEERSWYLDSCPTRTCPTQLWRKGLVALIHLKEVGSLD